MNFEPQSCKCRGNYDNAILLPQIICVITFLPYLCRNKKQEL